MENSERKRKQSEQEKMDIQTLRSGNTRAIIETITQLRNRGNIAILDEVFELMLIASDDKVLEACVKLLNDLKDKKVVPAIVEAVTDQKYGPIRKDLVASCWQSGLDYHEHLDVFIDVALFSDYATTLEAFTVIEDCIGQVDKRKRDESLEKLKKEINNCSEDTKPLITELISMIESYPG